MARVLFVTEVSFCPPHGGTPIRTYNLIDSLCEHHRVTLLAPRPGAPCALDGRVQAWVPLSPGPGGRGWRDVRSLYYFFRPYRAWADQLEQACRQLQPDVTWFDYGHWGQYVPIVKGAGSRAAIMDTHNIQSELTRQVLASLSPGRPEYWRKLARYRAERWHERRLFANFDLVVSVSEADRRAHARLVGDQHSRVIPNYVNESWYSAGPGVARSANLAVVTASFGAYQNRLGAEWLLTEVWPLVCRECPDAQLRLAGRNSTDLARLAGRWPNVTCYGEVDSTGDHLRQAALSLVPLHHASGSRVKILESWACGTPVVSTSLGAAGLEVADGDGLVLADTAADFARAIVLLLADAPQRDLLAERGQAIMRQNYGFAVNTARLDRLLADTLEQRDGHS